MRRQLVSLLLVLATFATAQAHEVRPAYLEIVETGPGTADVLFKVPASGEDLRLAVHLRLPPDVAIVGAPDTGFEGRAFVERLHVRRPAGLTGAEFGIDGLSSTMTDALVRVGRADGTTQVLRLTPDRTSFVVAASPGAFEVARTYGALGVEHILTGVDHLLFVLALVILVDGIGRLVWTLTAFTVAHSMTLAAATLGWVSVPPPPVEAVIALSIAFVAAEIVHARRGHPGLGARWPWGIAFAFGLLHGLGFAGALHEIGLPQKQIPLALLAFNGGVEVGQLLFVSAVLLVARAARLVLHRPLPGRWPEAAAYGIGTVAMFWVAERIQAFWS